MHIAEDGDKKFYFVKDPAKPGQWCFHREDGPAIDSKDHKEWWVYGKRHRIDGPAVEKSDSTEYWIDGKPHRDGGPAFEWSNGTYEYFQHGERHRVDGPAVKRLYEKLDENFNLIETLDFEETYCYKGKTFYKVKNLEEFYVEIMAEIIET